MGILYTTSLEAVLPSGNVMVSSFTNKNFPWYCVIHFITHIFSLLCIFYHQQHLSKYNHAFFANKADIIIHNYSCFLKGQNGFSFCSLAVILPLLPTIFTLPYGDIAVPISHFPVYQWAFFAPLL